MIRIKIKDQRSTYSIADSSGHDEDKSEEKNEETHSGKGVFLDKSNDGFTS